MKKSLFKYLTIIILLIIATVSYATNDLAHLLDSVKTMQANFTQTVYDNQNKAVQNSYGKMSLQRPGKFRWEVTKPIPQLIIANGSKLWIYDPDLQQVTIRSLNNSGGGTPALLLSHVDNVLDKDFAVKTMPAKQAGWSWFSLIPKQHDNMFESIQMGFSNKQIREMHLRDHLGHVTLIEFADATVNETLSSSLFVLKAPLGTDIIDETRSQ